MAFDLVKDLKGLNGAMRGALADLGGVRSPEMTAMGKILRRQMAKTLAVSGGGQVVYSIKTHRPHAVGGVPAKPGEPPHAQTKRLAQSVKAGVVGDAIWVGPLRFYGGFQEEGVNAVRGTRKVRKSGRGAGQRSGTVQRTVTTAARPYLLKALEDAKDDMAKEFGDLAGLSLEKKVR